MFRILLILALCLQPVAGFAAGKFSYDRFYESDPDFKKLDGELNSGFKKLMNEASWADKRVLLDEQRKWHRGLFSLMTEDKAFNKKPEEAAREVLRARVDDFNKLLNAPRADNILGMPISFGLSKNAVAEKLGLKTPDALDARPGESDGSIHPYKIKLFGEEVPVYFDFARTKIAAPEKDASAFASFATETLKRRPDGSAVELDTLYAVFAGELESREDFSILNEELAKKYKRAYPQYPPLASFLEDSEYFYAADDDSDLVNSSTRFVYEDKKRYIIVAGSWGTMTGAFNITYLSKPYAALHIASIRGLANVLRDIGRYQGGLVLVPEGAPLTQVVYAIGDRELTWEQMAGKYYKLYGDYADGDTTDSASVAMTPDGKAFAATAEYVDGDAPNNFEDALVKSLEKKYKRLKDTPPDVISFLGHVSNQDFDFETEDNYIHIGFTPHFAVQHELTIINKKEAARYAKIQDAEDALAREKADERAKEVREESSKF